MAIANTAIAPSSRPDTAILDRLVIVDRACLAIATLVAATTLAAWLSPAFGSSLPHGWSLMKASTALAILLCTASLALTKPKESARLILVGRLCAIAAMVLAVAALYEHATGRSSAIGLFLAPDSAAPSPGLMSVQSASFVTMLGLSFLIERTQQGWLGRVLDLLIGATVVLTLVLVTGYVFGAPGFYGQSSAIRTSPQSLVCLALLMQAQGARRAPFGFFSVLVGVGIGSHFARRALPIAPVVVVLLIGAGEKVLVSGVLTLPYAVAITAASMTALLSLLIVLDARKINGMERALREMSLADELTGLHNRRGFYLLGEQALRDARRSAESLTVVFLDADGLKKINDTLGHDVGSALLRDIATMLRAAFRSSDMVGRLGGDEFAVIAHARQESLEPALRRLREASDAANRSGEKPYHISFSMGMATTGPESELGFVELVDRADAAMYQDKRRRRVARESDVVAPPVQAPPLAFQRG
jgi:diguanylate cyclase (GGDEF)-like protein